MVNNSKRKKFTFNRKIKSFFNVYYMTKPKLNLLLLPPMPLLVHVQIGLEWPTLFQVPLPLLESLIRV